MNPILARDTIVKTFRQKFDDVRFLYFIRNLLNSKSVTFDESDDRKKTWTKQFIKAAFQDYVNHFTRLGTYSDPDDEKVDVLVIHLRKETTLARGRVTLRNFVADYLSTGHGQGKAAVMAAFVSPTEDDWRFSFVKLDYTFEKTDLGFVAEQKQLTPARRYSYLVGKNENCHTAQKQFLALLEAHEVNPTLAQLEAAFSVEKVTREFYDQYKELFEKTRDALAKFLNAAPDIKAHFSERGIECDDFAKKLLGQIVFLYFLQKKGWFGVESGKTWGSGRKDFIRHLFDNRADYAHIPGKRQRPANFFNDILEPLFYEAIASPRTDEDHYYSRFNCKIPFLNGGLFEPLYGYKWVETEILLPDTLFANSELTGEENEKGTGILDVFDRYNFTVNEAEPLEKEVAVDPEMLGLVFENLLPENIRHSSGTYYTPRAIVHYMCQQALLHHLTTRADDIPQADLALFLRLAERFTDFQAKETKNHADKLLPQSISSNASRLDGLLANIAVCDPAIGSGAFPVGMMLEIVRARMALAAVDGMPAQTLYHLKRHAIQHSLYGVDLDPGSVEIAKLRLWLSMVVDEDNITDIQPLPNLDYKIMQGNSLVEEFDGVRLLDEKLLQPPAVATEAEIADLKNSISLASQEFFRLHGEGAKSAAAKLGVEKEIKLLKKRLETLLHPDASKADGQGELKQQTSWSSLMRIKELHEKFFDEDSRAEKDKLRRELDALEWSFMEATLRERGREEAIAELKRASATHRKPFFLWRLHFGEVFQQRGGFDVVIGNPPYVRVQNLSHEIIDLYKRTWTTAWKRIDISTLFMELAMNICRRDGVSAFISSNQFLVTEYGRKTREFFLKNAGFTKMLDLADLPVFDNTLTYVSIFFQTPTPTSEFNYSKVAQLPFTPVGLSWEKISTAHLTAESWVLGANTESQLVSKLASENHRLDEYAKCWAGIITGLDEILLFKEDDERIEELEKEIVMPVLRAQSCDRYCHANPTRFTIYPYKEEDGKTVVIPEAELKREFPKAHAYLKDHKALLAGRKDSRTTQGEKGAWYGLIRFGKRSVFRREKIVTPGEVRRNKFALDKTGSAFSCARVFAITSESNKLPLLHLLGLLNSRLIEFFLHKTAPLKQGGYFSYNAGVLDTIPIRLPIAENQKSLERLVERILAAKAKDANADVGDLEREIDELVYALYALTPEEIKIVESAST